MKNSIINGLNLDTKKTQIVKKRSEEASKNKTPDWTLSDLEYVLKYLKKDKCRDPFGYINEIFKPDVCGKDLKLAILKLMNNIKEKQEYP